MKLLIIIFTVSLTWSFTWSLCLSSDSTKVKPNFKYKRVSQEVDSLEIKVKAILNKVDSLKQRKHK